MIDGDTALSHHLLMTAQAQGIILIPADELSDCAGYSLMRWPVLVDHYKDQRHGQATLQKNSMLSSHFYCDRTVNSNMSDLINDAGLHCFLFRLHLALQKSYLRESGSVFEPIQ